MKLRWRPWTQSRIGIRSSRPISRASTIGVRRLPTDDGSFQWENSNAISHTRAEPSLDAAPAAWQFRSNRVADAPWHGCTKEWHDEMKSAASKEPTSMAAEWDFRALYTAPQAASALREALQECIGALADIALSSDMTLKIARAKAKRIVENARKVLEG